PNQAVLHLEDLKHQHGIADVYAEFAFVFEVASAFGVIAEHAARGRDFDAEDERQTAQTLDLARVQMRRARINRDVGVVVEKDRQEAARAVKQAAHIALEKFCNVAYVAN